MKMSKNAIFKKLDLKKTLFDILHLASIKTNDLDKFFVYDCFW